MQTIVQRIKTEKGWRYRPVKEGRGVKTGELLPPFYVRYTEPGKGQQWRNLDAQTFAEAKLAAERFEAGFEAGAVGLTVKEFEDEKNKSRVPLKSAVDAYLEQKSGKAPKTVAQYTTALTQFLEAMIECRVKFIDEVTVPVLRKYKVHLNGYAAKTLDTRMNIVRELLAKNGNAARVPRDEMPAIEEEPAVPYSEDELKKLYAASDGLRLAFRFFAGTGCREQEVTYAAWNDINFAKGEYHIRRKEDVGFAPKSHESRTVPLPAPLLKELEAQHKKTGGRWVFTNSEANPEGHFLRHLKRIAKKAGLNCGHCINDAGQSCKTHPTCEHVYLHRFRKTCATRWHENGVPMRTLQYYLGHKSLEVTQKYLGVTDSTKLRSKIDAAFGD